MQAGRGGRLPSAPAPSPLAGFLPLPLRLLRHLSTCLACAVAMSAGPIGLTIGKDVHLVSLGHGCTAVPAALA